MILGENASEILTVKEPAIETEKIRDSNDDSSDDFPDSSKLLGYASPFIKINGFRLAYESITKFKIKSSGFRPSIELVFVDGNSMFDADFPKDGDIIELYLRSPNDQKIKKIRIDFDILNIKSNSTLQGISYNISGIMKIPDLLSEISLSFPNNTAYNHLLSVCDNTKLGFASNVTDTIDSMPRFNAKNTIQDFIQKTTQSSYKDEESFFTSYIDMFYYLNYVEVNSCFQTEGSLQDGDYDATTFANQDKDNTGKEGTQDKLLLSNHPKWDGTTNHIESFSLFNNAGDIWMKNGYKRYAESYNMQQDTFDSFFVDPLTTTGSETDNVILKGKAGDDSYENQYKYKYFGRSYSTAYEGNLHPNYYYAKIQNYQNLAEINKMGLVIRLNGISSSISKYRSIPLAIFQSSQQARTRRFAGDQLKNELAEDEETYTGPNSKVLDSFLSGWYVIKDFDIVWQNGVGFKQIVYLIRREWPMPYPGGNIIQQT